MPDAPLTLDVVLLYAPPWSAPTRFSKHHLASHLARRGARVLYVEAPLTPFGLRQARNFLPELGRARQAPRLAADRLWVRRHFLPLPYHAATWLTSRRVANRLGQRLLAPAIGADLRRLGMSSPVVVAGLPHAADLPPRITGKCLVYHCADDYAHAGGFPSTLPELEADLCRRADLVITTSATLCEERRPFNPNTHWVPNGVDFEHFAQSAAHPRDLQHIPGPIVGFVGGVSEWVDVELIAELALARPRYSFVLIGPIATDTGALRKLANIRLLGPRPYASLPGYLSAMDVALIPFKRNLLTHHADPIKAYEYLAAGLPVVATDLPSLHRLSHVVRLANSSAAFLQEIDAAVAEGRNVACALRQEEAARHSWSARFAVFEQLLNETLACAS